MTVTPSSPTVGIFKDRLMAQQAIDALYNAGFTSEQVRYSAPGTSGSILADLKSLFTGQNTNSGNVTNALTDMGLPNEEAQYYADEHANGNTILAVLASGREQEVLNILHQYGAYNARTSDSSSTTTYSQPPSNFVQQADAVPDDASLQQTNATPDGPSLQSQPTSWATQQQPSHTEEHPLQDGATDYSDTTNQNNAPDDVSTAQQPEYQPTQPLVPGNHSTPQEALSPNLAAPASTSDEQAAPSDFTDPASTSNNQAAYVEQTTSSDTGASDTTPELQNAQPDAASYNSTSVASDTGASDTAPELQNAQPDAASYNSTSVATPSDTGVSNSTPELQNPQSATATSEPADEFQQLQEQLQAAQQQLQDARAQLQAAKEHEAQIQTIREREQKLQAARQQLQDIQAQLQATLAELHETQGRITQY